MSRPQIDVTITESLARRGAPSPTGLAFFVYAAASGASGPATPVRCLTTADAVAAGVPTLVATYVGDCLAQGAPGVVVVKVTAANVSAVTQSEWAAGLALFTDEFGIGQVLIPGVATTASYAALLAHADATGRCVLLDSDQAPTPATLATTAAGLSAAAGAERAGLISPWVNLPAASGVRAVPGSVIAAGLAGRGDAAVGHSNQAPAGLQRGGAGVVARGVSVTKVFTDAETDTIYDAGVSPIRMVQGQPTLMGWTALSDVAIYTQLSTGRITMEIGDRMSGIANQFLFRNIDGRGHLYAEVEGALRGYLQGLWAADALYGETADDAFEVDVQNVNTADTAAAGTLRASVAAAVTRHAEKVLFNVSVSLPEGATA